MVETIVEIPLPGQIHEGARVSRPHLNLQAEGARPIGSQASEGTMSHFFAGPENRLVRVAVRNVLEEKSNGYNPIVLCGPSGTGKSHLALGLAAAWKTRNRRRVECTSAVDFARELADAIDTQAVEEFRAKYRKAGFLVFEDIGRMVNRKAEKLSAQDELIHTLDTLTNQGSWVIVTSASAPGEMLGILPALQSRLMAGLTVPIALPDRDTRLSIIQHLAQSRQIELPVAAARTLAEGIHGAVPEIMGALVQLEVAARRDDSRINVNAVRTLLAQRNNQCGPSLPAIALACAKHFGIKLHELRSPSRQQAVVMARNVAIFLMRNMIKCSLDQLGRYFGGRDHTTIMHSWRKMEKLLKTDPATRHEVEKLEQKLIGKKHHLRN
jgi:chromosomal replication initiator protein